MSVFFVNLGTSQRVLPLNKRFSVWEILASFRLSLRNVEISASTFIDGGVTCLSGRTAAYRTEILRDPRFQLEFTHEMWREKYHLHSGDDKFLTRWMQNNDWKTHIQTGPHTTLLSTFKDDATFLNQLMRWTRNSWRSDIKALIFERKIWKRHPWTAFTMLDRFFNPLTLWFGPISVGIIIYFQFFRNNGIPIWVFFVSYLIFLLATRFIKYYPHFLWRPYF